MEEAYGTIQNKKDHLTNLNLWEIKKTLLMKDSIV